MASRTVKRLLYGTLGALGGVLSLYALYLLGETTGKTGDIEGQYINILFVNIVGVLALLALTVGNLWRLIRDFRKHVPGAKLKARMVGMFVGLAVGSPFRLRVSRYPGPAFIRGFVRPLRRYYEIVRLPGNVHVGRTAFAFP